MVLQDSSAMPKEFYYERLQTRQEDEEYVTINHYEETRGTPFGVLISGITALDVAFSALDRLLCCRLFQELA